VLLQASNKELAIQPAPIEPDQQTAVAGQSQVIPAEGSKGKQNLTNLDRKLATLKEEMTATDPNANLFRKSAAEVPVSHGSIPPTSLNISSPLNRALPPQSRRL
jgi:hypothetical protein